MKGKLVLLFVVIAFGASGFSSGEKTDKVFNPMLPCNLMYHANLMKLPLDLFKKGDPTVLEIGYDSCDRYCKYTAPSLLYGASQNLFCEFRIDSGESGISIVRKDSVFEFKPLGMYVITKKMRNDKGYFERVSFFEISTGNRISEYDFDNFHNTFEIFSKNLFSLEGELYDIRNGKLNKKANDYNGFSASYYSVKDSLYSRMDDSFVFSMDNLIKKEYHPIFVECDDYIFFAKSIYYLGKTRVIEILKTTFDGKVLGKWPTGFLNFDESIESICNNKLLTTDLSNNKLFYRRLWDIDTGRLLWTLEYFGDSKIMFSFDFNGGDFYTASRSMAVRVTLDGQITYVPLTQNPRYVKFLGGKYLLKGLPGKNSDDLYCRLVSIEEKRDIDTNYVVPNWPNYNASGNKIIGWSFGIEKDQGVPTKTLNYSIYAVTGNDINQIKSGKVFFDCDFVYFDLDHFQVLEENIYSSVYKFRNFEYGIEKNIDVSKSEDFDNRNVRVLAINGNYFSLFGYGKDKNVNNMSVSIYRILPTKQIFQQSFEFTKKVHRGFDFDDAYSGIVFQTEKVLLFWSNNQPFHLIRISDLSVQTFDNWATAWTDDGKIFAMTSTGKLDVVDMDTFEIKTQELPPNCIRDDLFMFWADQYGCDQVFASGKQPQQMIRANIKNLVGNRFVTRKSNSGIVFEMRPCPAFAIKRISTNEFEITNTSPNCQASLDMKIFITSWDEEYSLDCLAAKKVVCNTTLRHSGERKTITLDLTKLESAKSNRFALVIESNGLLDTQNSELSDFDKEGRPLFDGVPISYDQQKSVVVTIWGYK